MKKRIKQMMMAILVIAISVSFNVQSQTANAAKKGYINNKNFRGTFSYDGHKGTFESGGYEVIINNISSKGKIKFCVSRWTPNASRITESGIITAKINGNKAVFDFTDSYNDIKGKGTFIFNKNRTMYVTMKMSRPGSFWSGLELKKTLFKKASKEYKISE